MALFGHVVTTSDIFSVNIVKSTVHDARNPEGKPALAVSLQSISFKWDKHSGPRDHNHKGLPSELTSAVLSLTVWMHKDGFTEDV